MLTLYTLTPQLQALTLDDMSSLDAVSRQLPQGLYSTFRTYAGRTKVLGLESHLERLYAPLPGLTVKAEVSPPELRAALREALSVYPAAEARVRITLARGQAFLTLEPLKAPAEALYREGARAVLARVKRETPRFKTTAFIGASDQARQTLTRSGAYEALMVHNGRILEGLTSNFYAVRQGRIITAREGILLGVTRRYVLRLARSNGFSLEYRAPRVEELSSLDEAFITSSARGVLPLSEIDGQPVGSGQVGEAARLLRKAYDEYVVRKAEKV